MIEFEKYHGCGNDFIVIDNTLKQFKKDKIAFARKWCERRFGIGSDGIIFIEEDDEKDFMMDFYNPDGSQSLCGNGSRCAVAYAYKHGLIPKSGRFNAIDGVHEYSFKGAEVSISMKDVVGIEKIGDDLFINTGSPHYISYCSESDSRDIVEFGREVRYSDRFKESGTNVNLIKKIADQLIDLRTYERGVEDETFACGTGATAAALSFAHRENLTEGLVKVKVRGGELKVAFTRSDEHFSKVRLIGPAEFVYKGEIDG